MPTVYGRLGILVYVTVLGAHNALWWALCFAHNLQMRNLKLRLYILGDTAIGQGSQNSSPNRLVCKARTPVHSDSLSISILWTDTCMCMHECMCLWTTQSQVYSHHLQWSDLHGRWSSILALYLQRQPFILTFCILLNRFKIPAPNPVPGTH
jgi:hypothetical protein